MATAKEIEELARDIYLAKYAKLGGRWELVETKEVWRKIAIERLVDAGIKRPPYRGGPDGIIGS